MERIARWIAWKLPRRIAYWCAIRVGAEATTGEWSHQTVPDLTFMDAVERWTRDHGQIRRLRIREFGFDPEEKK